MKYILTFLIILSFGVFNQTYAQTSKNNLKLEKVKKELNNTIFELNLRVDSLNANNTHSISVLNAKIDDLNSKSEIQKEDFTKSINNASTTIEYLNSVVSSFEIIFAILGIFIAILTLIIPFATYQYAVKPSQDALKDLESNFDSRLKTYLEDNRNRQIENALSNIQGESSELKHQGISFLTYIQNEGLSDDQLFQIYNILKMNLSDNSIKGQLAFILTTRKTIYSNELFNSIENLNDPVLKQMAIIYFAKTDYKENYNGITRILKKSETQLVDFHSLILNFNQYSIEDVKDFLNDSKIIGLLSDETLTQLKTSMVSIIKSLNGFDDEYKNTLLYKTIESKNA
jgi:hypothetical protein